jgi:hypothetical protein
MRAQGDLASDDLSAEPAADPPDETPLAERRLTADTLKDHAVPTNGPTGWSFLQPFIPALLRALSAWPT